MKILLINLPYTGHIAPTLGLTQELINQNHQVSYLLTQEWKEAIENTGATFCEYPNHWQLSEQIKFAYASAEKIIHEYDLVIYEQFFFLGKHLAEKYHKPVVRIFTAPATNKTLMNQFIQTGPLSIFKHKWIARAFTKDIAKNIPLKTDNWLDEIIENPPELNLVYTLRELQPDAETLNDMQYKFIGPSLYNRNEPIFEFKKDKPILYISLGTILQGKRSFFQCCIEAFRNENIDVIISVGKQFNIKRLKNVPTNVHLYSFVPQIKVLQMADIFITHGGMNSICEALVSSTPMVVIPLSSDQPVNAQSVEKLGVGKQLEYQNLNQNDLKNTVFSVLNDQTIKNNLMHTKQLIDDSSGNSGAVAFICDYYKKTLYE